MNNFYAKCAMQQAKLYKALEKLDKAYTKIEEAQMFLEGPKAK